MKDELIPNQNILRMVADQGVMSAQDLVAHVPRARGDYTDFIGVAALLQNGYLSTDVNLTTSDKVSQGGFGANVRDVAVHLYLVLIGPERTFQLSPDLPVWNGFPRDFTINVFITGDGILKLEEIALRAQAAKTKRRDYLFAVLTGVVVAIVSSLAAHYFNPSAPSNVIVAPSAPNSDGSERHESEPG